jgi:hypothetical protein
MGASWLFLEHVYENDLIACCDDIDFINVGNEIVSRKDIINPLERDFL